MNTTPESAVQRVLTGITTTGTPHLGNYVGAIRPALLHSRDPAVRSFYFLADLHGLVKCPDPDRIRQSTLEIAATWLAAGLDPSRVFFYRQSDIIEIAELNWLLTCVTGKGLLNRAHAYKAATDRNVAAGVDPDADVSAGLFMYPVLMAADILMFNAHKVPVGRDQVQHLEMTRDIAARFNHLYGEHFTLPAAVIEADVATLPGLDGRKMSKSYDNTIPLFSPPAVLEKLIAGIVTDSRAPGEPKDTEGSALFQIYQAFATPSETTAMRRAFAEGIGWREAKRLLFERVDQEIRPMRGRYEQLMADPAQIEAILGEGAARARALATPFAARLRQAVGLRRLQGEAATPAPTAAGGKGAKASRPVFKQYRERDGRFHFKLLDGTGRLLVQSLGFASPREAGQAIAQLQGDPTAAIAALGAQLAPLEGVGDDAIVAALEQMSAD